MASRIIDAAFMSAIATLTTCGFALAGARFRQQGYRASGLPLMTIC